MKRVLTYLCLAFAMVFLLACSKKGRVIPRDDMAEIYADLFMTDEWAAHQNFMRKLDSLSLYAAVLERHGYTVEDFRASIDAYLDDPDRFSRILKNTRSILEDRKDMLEKEQKILRSAEQRRQARLAYVPEFIYQLSGLDNPEIFTFAGGVEVYVDTTGTSSWMFDEQKGRDTIYIGPRMQIESLDSLSVAGVEPTDSTQLESVVGIKE
ncbi:MAG: DUF4296 domain-containing protein [Bacteroidales bacterium]|nr:DUF4296 domain-containing protein [Bacteroidales bacterium]